MISPGIFSYFLILIFWAVRGIKGQKKPKMKSNNYICHVPYLRNSIAYDHDFWYTCVKWWYLWVFFFHFFKIWFFELLGGKRAKNDTKWQKCLSHSISQEAYIIWSGFLVHMCKIMTSPVGFFIFSKFWFLGLLRGKRGENGSKWKKSMFVSLRISGTVHHMILIFVTYV